MDYENYTTNYEQNIADKRKVVNDVFQYQFNGDKFAINNFGAAEDINTMKRNFNRFRVQEGIDYFTSNVTYIFFTKPQMNLINAAYVNDSFIRSMQNSTRDHNKMIMENLDGVSATTGPFNFILSNAAESFDLKDNVLSKIEVGDTRMGHRVTLGDNAIDSYNSGEFTVEYTELADMSITKMHKIWLDYIDMVKHNLAAPYMQKNTSDASFFAATSVSASGNHYYSYSNGVDGNRDFIKNRELDYVCSVYYFKVADDGMTLKYWAKYTGVFPLNVPYSALSFSVGDNKLKQMNVNYAYSFKEDMSIEILEEFNMLCLKNGGWSTDNRSNFTIDKNWAKGVCLTPNLDKILFINK